MNPLVAAILAAALAALIVFKLRDTLVWVVVIWLSVLGFLRFGFAAPLPASIISEYMTIASLALVIYVLSSPDRLKQARDSLLAFLTEKRHATRLKLLVVVISILVGAQVYLRNQVTIQAPVFGRTVHPAPPTTIVVKGKTIDLIKGANPYRELQTSDPGKFKAHVSAGKKIYYQNCFFCHGDNLRGNGHFSHALDPIPTDFADPATIAMLQENFLFWRIAKGGIGLPVESAPWASAMPAWEDFLAEEDIWNVILFLYDYTNQKPRAQEHGE